MPRAKAIKEFNIPTDLAKFTDRQMDACELLIEKAIKYLLYGGAMGGGKSYFLRWYAICRLVYLSAKYNVRNLCAMLACEDYPALKDRQISKAVREFPSWLGKFHSDHAAYGRCFILRPKFGSGVLCFRNLDDPSKYQSAEFVLIEVDELTKNKREVFDDLRTRIRWPGIPDEECQFVGGSNPGGIGHGWVKQLWIKQEFPQEFVEPIDYRPVFAYVPSRADDNPHLDPAYWNMLNTLPEARRKAFRDGNWDIFIGQAFPEFSRTNHVINPFWPIPQYAPLYMTFDWGFGAPFSVGFWWIDSDGRKYRFGEWYGWSGTANQGLRLPDSEIAKGIMQRLDSWKLLDRPIHCLAGPDCFQKKPDYRGGGQGPSTAEVFAEATNNHLLLTPGDADRKLKIRTFREHLVVPDDGAMPMLVVYDSCQQFLRTIPDLVMDENNIEDIDTKGEDHIFDEACHICQYYPVSMRLPERPKYLAEKIIEEVERGEPQTDDEIWNEMVGGNIYE